MNKRKPLRVGFDLDGVILYNPVRIIRPLISFVKHLFLHKKLVSFYVPSNRWEKLIFRLFHYSSIFVAPGFAQLKQMADSHEIEAYIITARYNFLKADFHSWLRKIDARRYFVECKLNENNQQPHIFKREMIEKFNFDVFVDDNWDIVQYLSKNTKATVIWVTNIFDHSLPYRYKCNSIAEALLLIHSLPQKL